MNLNLMAIIVAVIANFIFGFLWYTPIFGRVWAKEMGFDPDCKPDAKQKKLMMRGMLFMIIGNFLFAFVFAHNIQAWQYVPGVSELSLIANVMNAAIFTWLGFYLPVDIGVVTWENKSWKLFFINTGYHLISLLLVATILIAMK